MAAQTPAPDSPGSSVAASDLYGTGVRVGIYLQTFGMLFSCIRLKCSGMKLAGASIILALLGSWCVVLHRQEISPVEAWIILAMIGVLYLPAGCAISCPRAIVGEGVGTFAMLAATLWHTFAMIVFWASIYKKLPILDTPDVAFFFAKVSIRHWFRDFMLAISIFQLVFDFIICIGGASLLIIGAQSWCEGEDEPDLERLLPNYDLEDGEALFRSSAVFCAIPCLIGIVGIEMMIKWNGLHPVSDMAQPGQAIPLAIGIIILVDGLMGLCQPARD